MTDILHRITLAALRPLRVPLYYVADIAHGDLDREVDGLQQLAEKNPPRGEVGDEVYGAGDDE